jgi:hypothetical protein
MVSSLPQPTATKYQKSHFYSRGTTFEITNFAGYIDEYFGYVG